MMPMEFTAPTLDYLLLLPFLIVLGAACLGILLEAFLPRRVRFVAQAGLSILGLLAGLVALIWRWGSAGRGGADPTAGSASGAVSGDAYWSAQDGASATLMIDGPVQVLWAILFGCALIAVVFYAERHSHGGATAFTPMAAAIPGSNREAQAAQAGLIHSEVFPLTLFSLSGMALLVAANDLLVMFVAVEILSLPLYVMSGLARHRRLASQEAALKYFLLGAAASAILLFGVALLFGYAGGFGYEKLAFALSFRTGGESLLLAGMGLVAVGLLFKIGAVPFQSWVPDVYQGAPTPVTAFMSVCTKVAAVGALLRLFYVGLGGLRWTWQPILAGIAILTIVVGAIVAINQSDVKRVLAYSSIAHAGFVLVPLVGALTIQSGLPAGQIGSVVAVEFYLVAYGLATIGCFTIISLVRAQGREVTKLSAWAGLGRRNPVIGVTMVIFLLSLAGIPLTAGFIGKFLAFAAAWRGGYQWLALVAILGSVIAVYIYVRVIQVMFFQTPADDEDRAEVVQPGMPALIVLALCLIGTLGLFFVPGPLLDVFQAAGSFLIPSGS
ncbi:MAG: NADH-quinone oxidoreductase subunit NuoN [Propionibacteriaceae bacterium]|jgi:NADH-quinone oxidoreductase subunit N|nr:NADH-quinone oxidoreductase subunit NuoN [Propionibacteriaceae bacterium]